MNLKILEYNIECSTKSIFFADDFSLNRTLRLAKKDFRSSRAASDSTKKINYQLSIIIYLL